jgi:KilA-N domain
MKTNTEVTVLSETVRVQRIAQEDFISLTDIAKFKNADAPADIIKNWLRSRSTVDLLGLWEKLNNPSFKLVEFDQFRFEAGENTNMALFGKTAKDWRDANPGEKGNIRDQANASQLVCLANLENLNALFINEGMPQPLRLQKLNRIAIEQMQILTNEYSRRLLGEGETK